MFTSLSLTNHHIFYSVIQPFLLSFVPVTQLESPSRLTCVSKHDLSTLKKRSLMERVGTHQKLLLPSCFPPVVMRYVRNLTFLAQLPCYLHGHLNWETHLMKESSLCNVKLWLHPPRQSSHVWNR